MTRLAKYAHWGIAVVWASTVAGVGPTLGDALTRASRPVQITASVGLWLGWGLVLVATLVRLPATLVVLRAGAPLALVAAIAAAIAHHVSALALGVAALAAIVPFGPGVSDRWVQGGAYGHEKRFVLRAPGSLLMGPIEVFWMLMAAGLPTGPLLLASKQWVLGVVLTVIGWFLAAIALRGFWQLADRWIVVVPAGMVLHDRLALAETAMFETRMISSIGPATIETIAHDFTLNAPGLALEIRMHDPVPMIPRPSARGDRAMEAVTPMAWLCTPSSPASVMQALATDGRYVATPPATTH